MRGVVEDIQIIFNKPTPTTFYLEKDSIGAFSSWIEADSARRVSLLEQGIWQVEVFKSQIQTYVDYRSRRHKLKEKLFIEVNDYEGKIVDSLFIDEVERVYFFNSGVIRRQLAEFYLMVRRVAGNGWVNIISQDYSFERIPMVNTYFVGASPRTGIQDLPAQFDFLQDFRIHSLLANKIKGHIGVSPNGLAIQEAIIELEDYLQLLTGLATNGRNLMEQAFRQDGTNRKLNPLTDTDPTGSQQNEQKGFREFYCGTWTGLRNPLTHEGTGGAFAQTRYPDRITLFKYLSLLSILFERADGPLP